MGTGKTFIGMAFARRFSAMGRQTHVLTSSKILQDQYLRDFPAPQVEDIKGRATYGCTHRKAKPGTDCAEGWCKTEYDRSILQDCLKVGEVEDALSFLLDPEDHHCPYWAQLTKAVRNPVTIFNYKSFLAQQRVGRFGKRKFMILDECHNVEAELMSFVEIKLSNRILDKIGVELERDINSKEELISWLDTTQLIENLQRMLGFEEGEQPEIHLPSQELEELNSILLRLEFFRKNLDRTDWVIETKRGTNRRGYATCELRGRPLWVSVFADELIFSKAEHVLAMSGTILNINAWCRNLGLKREEVGFVSLPSPFPVKNRRIVLDYAANFGKKHREHATKPTWPAMFDKIRQILDRHPNWRGIIHTHSDEISRRIVDTVRSPRFFYQARYEKIARNKNEAKVVLLQDHADRPDGVIVAPAMHEGLDLKDDLSRFQIIVKVPWPDMTDKHIAARMAVDEDFLPLMTILKLIQSCGRSVRSADDWAHTYIIDRGFQQIRGRYKRFFPKWFMDAVIEV